MYKVGKNSKITCTEMLESWFYGWWGPQWVGSSHLRPGVKLPLEVFRIPLFLWQCHFMVDLWCTGCESSSYSTTDWISWLELIMIDWRFLDSLNLPSSWFWEKFCLLVHLLNIIITDSFFPSVIYKITWHSSFF